PISLGNWRSALPPANHPGSGGSGRASKPRSNRSPRGWKGSARSGRHERGNDASDDRYRDEPVDSIEHPSVAGDQSRAVLHARPAFEPAFEEVADLGHDRESGSQHDGAERVLERQL